MKVSCPILKKRIKRDACIAIHKALDKKGSIDGIELTPRQVKKCRRCSNRPGIFEGGEHLNLDDMVLIDILDGEF